MLGSTPLPPDERPNIPPPTTWNDQVTADLNKTYPNAIDGDAVMFLGPTDAPELWVKYGSQWQPGWLPGSGPGMTMEARPDYKRIIADLTNVWGPGPNVVKTGGTTTTGIDAGKIAIIGLLGFLLLRGAIK